jgi:hypothetical protein
LLGDPETLRLFAGGALMLGAAILSQLPVGKAQGAPPSGPIRRKMGAQRP